MNNKPENDPPCPKCGSSNTNSPYWIGVYRGCFDCGHSWQITKGNMKKGTRVSWLLQGASQHGSGITISDEEDGHVDVAVDSMAGEPNPGYHIIIHCAVTWLTVEPLH